MAAKADKAAKRKSAGFPPRTVKRLTVYAALSPLLMLAIGLLGTGPYGFVPALFLGALTMAVAISLLIVIAQKVWLFFAGLVTSVAIMFGGGMLFQAELMHSQGQRTEVLVTSVSKEQGKGGPVYHCKVRRTDGRAMDHTDIVGLGCEGPQSQGTTLELLVDPSGWLAPGAADTDFGDIPVDLGVVGVSVALFELAVWRALRLGLRAAGPARTEPERER
ncbi:hypothetical protein [Kitasatospora viridis]|uniref:Uncharacterized protein n=1 Tax=Kitasatospora viridis TaxID=281105 RepID=A0A561UER5_9ACTN|nr:hypothetical protein [Kitasatospora viridis]TWF97828.1 hypothetical protein FHX73_111628 [Kitasatospora viridis]